MNAATDKKKLVVIGGGAAGFFCAINAARLNPQLQVTIIEKTSKLLSKVRISGGGRCNVTHACFEIDAMIKNYPRGTHFVKKSFHHFFTTDTIKWFRERGVVLKTEDDGRMFPASNSSQTIIDCLLQQAKQHGVEIITQKSVIAVDPPSNAVKEFNIHLSTKRDGDSSTQTTQMLQMRADYLCIACGGYSKAEQFSWIQAMGHTINPPVPSLFTFNLPGNKICAMPGLSVENVQVKIAGTKLETRGPLLITHWGLSGPAILKLSAWGARNLATHNYHFTALVNWLAGITEQVTQERFAQYRTERPKQQLHTKNPFGLPARLWEYLITQAGVREETRWAELENSVKNKLVSLLCRQEFAVSGKTTFKEEFVTAGGVALSEIDPHTMFSKRVPNLAFAGEITDVDGVTGGFNFQYAWTSGWIAGASIAKAAGD